MCFVVQMVPAQDGVVRPQRRPSDWNWVDNTPAGQLKAKQLIDESIASIGKAITEIHKVLPVYSGHANQAKYLSQYALEDLNSTLQYQRHQPDGTAQRRQPTADMRERLKNIPKVKDKSRRDYARDLVKVSDAQLNTAGQQLLHARECVIKIRDEYGGHLTDAKRLIDMAIDEIRRSIGTIQGPSGQREGFDIRDLIDRG